MTDRILPYSTIEELWHTYEDFEDFACAIEQDVLHSEQVQAWKRDAERMRAALQRIAAMDSMSYHSLDSAKITANAALEDTV